MICISNTKCLFQYKVFVSVQSGRLLALRDTITIKIIILKNILNKNLFTIQIQSGSTHSGSLKEIPDNSSQNIEKKRSFFNIRKRKTKSTN